MNLAHGVLPFPQLHSGSSNRNCLTDQYETQTSRFVYITQCNEWDFYCHLCPDTIHRDWCWMWRVLWSSRLPSFVVGSPCGLRASPLNFIWSCPAKPQINVCFTAFKIVCVTYAVSVDALCKGVCWRSKDNFKGQFSPLRQGFLFLPCCVCQAN